MNLLKRELGEKFEIALHITRANLPSITELNKWPKEAEVWRELDSEGHKNRPYPSSLLKQFHLVKEAMKKAKTKLELQDCLLVTADHGLTRYGFCSSQSLLPPKGVTEIHKWGRCAKIGRITHEITNPESPWIVEGNEWLCLLHHSRFKGGTGASNEVHGGATPEEVLVPVIKITPKDKDSEIYCRIISRKVELNIRKEGVLEIEIFPTPERLEIKFISTGQIFMGHKKRERVFSFTLKNIDPGKHEVILSTRSKQIKKWILEIVGPAGLEEEDLGI